ncbi:MAG TPA: prepilin-type N-terminal cleavage/methylation domain-containing protein [Pirellulales bacterium]|jgi:prepilin-type N-terminal cleavage/methylation domain-containing protein
MHLLDSKPLKQAGFTLIELSIVLVIIGLIVGGVLVGQDLIKAAEIRATVGQVEKYNAAVNTFRTKYNGIPGDLVYTQASAFGLVLPAAGITSGGGTGLGDGNGLIQDTASANAPIGEPLIFWQHLSTASLIDGSLGTNITSGAVIATSGTVSQYLPSAKLGRGNYWVVGSDTGTNYYILGGVTSISSTAYTYSLALTPIESYNIDVKLDDGAPDTGIVQARTNHVSAFGSLSGTYGSTIAPTTGCIVAGAAGVTDPSSTYNRGTTSGTTPNCMLRFRFN